jgi:predicted enzyme related to lactoylglutathione lyase
MAKKSPPKKKAPVGATLGRPSVSAKERPAKKAPAGATRGRPSGSAKKGPAKKPAEAVAAQTMPKARHGEFIWNELMTRDDDRALDFFAKVLGWTHEDWPMGGEHESPYRILQNTPKGPKGVGGIMKMTEPMFPPQVPTHWCSYVAVDDVDRRALLVKANGGEIVHGPENIPQVGRFCILKDPTGAVLAFMTPEGGTA